MQLETEKRLSRWSPHGGRKITLTKFDIQILLTLGRYDLLTGSYIAGLLKRSEVGLRQRTRHLSRTPNSYIRVVDEITKFRNPISQNVFELADKGRAVLRDQYIDLEETGGHERRYLEHQLMVDTVFASLEIASEARFVHPSELLARPGFPYEQRSKKRPFTIPVSIVHTNRQKKNSHAKYDYTHDGIRSLEKDGGWLHLQLEAEHMNQVYCSNLTQQSFLKKFLSIKYIMEHRLYQKHWGIDRLLTLVVVPNQHKLDTMKALILSETKGEGTSYIFFRVIPMFGEKLKPIKDIYTGAWQRAGHPDISLKELFDGRK